MFVGAQVSNDIDVVLTQARYTDETHSLLVTWSSSPQLEREPAFLVIRELKEDKENAPLIRGLASHEDLVFGGLKPNSSYELKVGNHRIANS
jgi:hypothetical protein